MDLREAPQGFSLFDQQTCSLQSELVRRGLRLKMHSELMSAT